MGKHSIVVASQSQPKGAGTALLRTRRRPALAVGVVSSFATLALVLVVVVDPYSGEYASAAPPQQWSVGQDAQTVVVAGTYTNSAARDSYAITDPPAPVVVAATATTASTFTTTVAAPPAGTPDPGSAKAIAQQMLAARGMGDSQFSCLVSLWNKESGWNIHAANKSSGAFGIPQALPGSKMASAGADWQSNPATQITWGLGYITGRYQTPCGAWTHSQALGWY